jgi:transcription elongation factor Elf1
MTCKTCGDEGELRVAVDPVADELIVACATCGVDIAVGDIRYAELTLQFETSGADRIDPALDEVREAVAAEEQADR